MFSRSSSRNRPTLLELEEIRENRTLGIRRVFVVSGLIILSFVAFLASMLVLPPLIELRALEQQRDLELRRLRQTQAEEARQKSIYDSMQDAEFFEHMARDRGNLAKDGETVIRRPAVAKPVTAPPRRD